MSGLDIYDKLIRMAPSQTAQPLAPPDPQDPQGQEPNIYRQILAERQQSLDERMAASFTQAVRANPDVAGEAQRLAARIRSDPLLVERNIETVRQKVRRGELEATAAGSVLAQMLLDPNFSRIAHDDLDNLGLVELVSQSFEQGQLIVERGFIGERLRSGSAAPVDRQRLAVLEGRLADLGDPVERVFHVREVERVFAEAAREFPAESQLRLFPLLYGALPRFGTEAAKLVGQQSLTLPQVLTTGLEAGIVAGGAAAVAGPGAPVTTPVATVAGFTGGALVEMARQTYRIEAGNAYIDMIQAGLDQERAANAAMWVGFVNAALESTGAAIVTKPFRSAVSKAMTREVAEGLARPVTGEAAKQFVTQWAQSVGGEVGTEVLQEVSNVLGEVAAGGDPQDIGERLGDIAVRTFQGMTLLGGIGPAVNVATDAVRIRRAERDAKLREQRAKTVTESKVRQRNPDAFETFSGRTVAGTAAETTYVPAERFSEAMEQAGMTLQQLERDLPEVARQLPDALTAGSDIVIPTGTYDARITGTELGNALEQHARLDPDGYSVAELPEVKAQQKVLAEQAAQEAEEAVTFAESAFAVEDAMRQQLEATGRVPRREARDTAAAYRAFVETQSERLGILPQEFAERFPVNVVRGEGVGSVRALTVHPVLSGKLFEVRDASGRALERFATQERAEEFVREHPQGIPDVPTPTKAEVEDFARTLKEGDLVSDGSNTYRVEGMFLRNVEATEATKGEPEANITFKSPGPKSIEAREFGLDEQFRAEDREGLAIISDHMVRERQEAAERSGTFDPNDPNILRQQTRASFDPTTGTIALFQGADVTSVLHELSHAFLDTYGKVAAQPDAPQQVVQDMQTFLEWRGIEGGVEAWNAMPLDEQRPHHEAFAESFETYAFEGKAPSLALQGIFSRFRRWIVRLWRNLRGQIPELSPEIRGVFDRMLASEDAIAHAEAARGLQPMFETQEASGMTDAQWADYQRGRDAATDAAVQEVQRRSLRDMQWLSRASGKELRRLQRQHDETRAQVRAEAQAEVEATPEQRAIRFIRRGEFVNENGEVIEFEGTHKLQTDAVRAVLPEGTDLRRLAITSPEGLAPDQVASMFDFDSGEDLVTALVDARPADEIIDARTDERMTAEHADLVDARAVQQAVDEALHNPARARFVATELKALTRAVQPVRTMVAAAREQARENLSRIPVAQIKPWRFQAAERRHNRAAMEAASKGETAVAIAAKRAELLQHEMAREAALVEREVDKAEISFRRFFKTDEKLAKTRDIDIIQAARALLRSVQFRPEAQGQAAQQQETALETLRRDFQPLHDRIQSLRSDYGGQGYRTLTLEQFREVSEAANAAWDLSRSSQLLDIAGRKVELTEAVQELQAAIVALPRRTAPGATAAEGRTPKPSTTVVQAWWHYVASAKRLQHWARFMDGGKPDGPFERLILRPMLSALDEYRQRRAAIFDRIEEQLRGLMKSYGPKWDADIAARPDELPVPGQPGRGFVFRGVRELVDVLLDIGNPSNMAKRLVGEGWAPNPNETGGVLDTSGWDAFFARKLQDGTITPELIEFVRTVWNEFATLKPDAQRTHKAVLGYEFEELELQDVVLPWGTIEGGYAPVRVDHRRAKRPRRQQDVVESIQGMEQDYEYSRRGIGTGRGFTLSRNPNYFDRLTMDIGRRLTNAIDAELRFIYLQPHVRSVLRITTDPAFEESMTAYDREAIRTIIHPWLDSTARQATSRPSRIALFDWMASALRSATGVAYLGMNFVVAAVQLTGLQLSRTQVKARYHWSGVRRFLHHPIEAWNEAAAKSVRMDDRLKTYQRRIQQALSRQKFTKMPRTWQAFRDAAGRFAWLPIRIAQGMVDVVTWHGAYQQSIAEAPANADLDAVEKKAVQDADLAVERSQGGNNPENLARFEADTPAMKLFFQFMSFSNTLLNQTLVRAGLSRTMLGRIGNFLWLPFIIGIWETVARLPFEGMPEDDEDDGPLDDLAERLALNYGRNVAGMLPILGPSLLALASSEADRLATTPAVSAAKTAWRGLESLFDDEEATGSDARAIGILITMVTGVTVTPISKAIGVEMDVESGRIEPASGLERIRRIITGRASEGSR